MPVAVLAGWSVPVRILRTSSRFTAAAENKTPEQLIGEIGPAAEAGWRNEVFIVDDNFIGITTKRWALCARLAVGRKSTSTRFRFTHEASIDLADRPELIGYGRSELAMYVFTRHRDPSSER